MSTGRFRQSTGALADVFTYVDALAGTVQESRDLTLVPTDDVGEGEYFALPVATAEQALPTDVTHLQELGDSKMVLIRLMIIREDVFYADIIYGESLLPDALPAGTLALAFEAPVQLLGVKDGHLQQLTDEGVI
ncbi:hypothetical protein B484DRAFT_441058, partial [Ochromonadaceae sp. CCMP2298]